MKNNDLIKQLVEEDDDIRAEILEEEVEEGLGWK